MDVSSIGTRARIATSGALKATAATTPASVAARLYAGAVEATPMTMLEISPSAPDLRPFWATCSPDCWASWIAATAHPSWQPPQEGRAGPCVRSPDPSAPIVRYPGPPLSTHL